MKSQNPKTDWETRIPNSLIHSSITDGALRVMLVLMSFASRRSPQPFPSWDCILRSTGICPNTLSKRLRELEKTGLIRRRQLKQNGHYGRNVYQLFPDDEASIEKRQHFLPANLVHFVMWSTITSNIKLPHTKSSYATNQEYNMYQGEIVTKEK